MIIGMTCDVKKGKIIIQCPVYKVKMRPSISGPAKVIKMCVRTGRESLSCVVLWRSSENRRCTNYSIHLRKIDVLIESLGFLLSVYQEGKSSMLEEAPSHRAPVVTPLNSPAQSALWHLLCVTLFPAGWRGFTLASSLFGVQNSISKKKMVLTLYICMYICNFCNLSCLLLGEGYSL